MRIAGIPTTRQLPAGFAAPMSAPIVRPGGYPAKLPAAMPSQGFVGRPVSYQPIPSQPIVSEPILEGTRLGPQNGFEFWNENTMNPPNGFNSARFSPTMPPGGPPSPYQDPSHHRQDHGPAGPAKISVWIEGARGLKSGDWFSKSDPYCVCQLSEQKTFQTNVLDGAGPDPQWHFGPKQLEYHGEPEIHFLVYDKDVWPKSDDLLGRGSIPHNQFMAHGGFEGEISLSDGTKHKGGTLRVRIHFEEGHSSGAPLHSRDMPHSPQMNYGAAHAGAGAAPNSSLESQLRQLLEGQQKMQEDMYNMQNQMVSNYHQCMEETSNLRRDIAQNSFGSQQQGPYGPGYGHSGPGGGGGYGQHSPYEQQSYDRNPYQQDPYANQRQKSMNRDQGTFNTNPTKSSMKTSNKTSDSNLVQKSHKYICC